MQQLRVHGQRESDPSRRQSPLERALPGTITVKHSVRVGFAREGHEPVVLDGVAPDDVIEMELDGGVRLWSSVEYLRGDFGLRASRDASGTDTLDITTQLPLGGQSRGVGDWVIRGLKVLGVDIAGTISDFVADKVEGQLAPGPGLYLCSSARPNDLATAKKLNGRRPTLVFLHGTGSSTDGSFGGLWKGPGARIGEIVQSLWRQPSRLAAPDPDAESDRERARPRDGARQDSPGRLRAAPRLALAGRVDWRAHCAGQPHWRRFVRPDRLADHEGQRPPVRCGRAPRATRSARQAALRGQPIRARRVPGAWHHVGRQSARQVSVGDPQRPRSDPGAPRKPRVRHVCQPARRRGQEADRPAGPARPRSHDAGLGAGSSAQPARRPDRRQPSDSRWRRRRHRVLGPPEGVRD